VLLSQDEARVPMGPTVQATLGVKGHRPVVGTRDCEDVLYVFAVLNLISGAIHANTLESLQVANRKSAESKTRRMQKAFAAHLRHVGRAYPQERHKRVVLERFRGWCSVLRPARIGLMADLGGNSHESVLDGPPRAGAGRL
jgi:hypothetical protein